MRKTKYSPAPWTISISPPEHLKYGKVMGRVMGGDGHIVATCEYGTYGYDTETVEANTRLIAAAPDMLKALKIALIAFDNEYPPEVWKDYPAIAIVQAAIAKAENE